RFPSVRTARAPRAWEILRQGGRMEEAGRGRPIADFRSDLRSWLDAHRAEIAPTYAPPGTLDEQVAQMQRVKARLFDAGWMRHGWPERVGGLGGSPMLRTE